MTKKRALGLGGLVLLAIAGGGWWRWTRITPPVTEAEARAYLDRIVAAARAHDFDKLCHLNGAVNNCRYVLDNFDLRDDVPPEPPTVTGTRYVREKGSYVAGRVLVVEGKASCGVPYRTEVFVFRENRYHFKAINAVYWSNFNFLEAGSVTSPGVEPPSCP